MYVVYDVEKTVGSDIKFGQQQIWELHVTAAGANV